MSSSVWNAIDSDCPAHSYAKYYVNVFHDLLCSALFLTGGKRNEQLILPINDSISGTLSTNEVRIHLHIYIYSLLLSIFVVVESE